MESKREVHEFLKKRKAYVGTDGKFLYDVGTDTVNIVLANMTGDPVVDKNVEYREEETSHFTHHGKKYSINKVLEQLIQDRTQPVLINWLRDQVMPDDKLDEGRLQSADTSIPVLVAKEGDKYWLVDGNHRLAKAVKENKKWLRAYLLTQEILSKAQI